MIESIKAKAMHYWTEHKYVVCAVAFVVVVLLIGNLT